MSSRLSPEEIEIRKRMRDDFPHYATKALKVRTKAGTPAQLILNRSQLHLHQAIEEQKRRTGRVRILVLKGRQVGISTYIAARFYHRTTHWPGLRTFILAHQDDASENLFGIANRYHDQCPPLFRPSTGKANAKELSFPGLDAGYKVATAGGRAVGRSDTIQLMHGSEVAYWPNADEHFAGVMQAVAEAPGTEIILESTANGIGNVFHSLWRRAERGESDFQAVFIPWYWHEEYASAADSSWVIPSAWAEYGRLHSLTRDQLNWSFRKNRDLVAVGGGSIDEPCPLFKQEYPGTASEAFETSGEHAFIDPLRVLRARKANVEGYGPLIIGVDPARGGRDKTGLIDRQGRRAGAHVCKRIDFGENTMGIAGEIVRLRNELSREHPIIRIAMDTTGLGGPIYDRLREQLPHGEIISVSFGERANNSDRFLNRRAEIYDAMREWFADPAGVQIPDNDELHGDLTAIVRGPGATRFDSAGRLVLEPKEHVRERLGFSPDLSDALAVTFAINTTALSTAEEQSDVHRGRSGGRYRPWEDQRDPWSF